MSRLIFEYGAPGRMGCSLTPCDVEAKPIDELLPGIGLRSDALALPEVSEGEAVRHFVQLSKMNHHVDLGFYPLGSCTMKYNPKLNEMLAALPGFSDIHPLQDEASIQGALQIMHRLSGLLGEITGLDGFSLQPAAGAHGELTGLMMVKAYHEKNGHFEKDEILIPDSAHGTNPSSAALAGFKTIEVPSDARGNVDLHALKQLVNVNTAGLMLTNPNTLGLFEENIEDIAALIHGVDGLLYYDGANLNAIMGYSRPGDMGFDIVHLNLHKTFSTPHGGGGPGAGPVGVKQHLIPFLPSPIITYRNGSYTLDDARPDSIGRVKSFYGNFTVLVKAYAYILTMGAEGLKQVSEAAVLNANYIRHHLKDFFELPYPRTCMHECVFSAAKQKEDNGISALDIAKGLIDKGIHPPTMYFPLIVKEALMVEPTETESKQELDAFIDAMKSIAQLAQTQSEQLKAAPLHAPVRRLDEVNAAKNPVVRHWHSQ